MEVPAEMMLCLEEEPKALKFFNSLTESQRQNYIKWIYSAKKEETKVERLARTVNNLMRVLMLHDRMIDFNMILVRRHNALLRSPRRGLSERLGTR